MVYNMEAVAEKEKYIDSIENEMDIAELVIRDNVGDEYTIEKCNRIWTGGGASIFLINYQSNKIILKIKKSSVLVESKLEEEPQFLCESCLYHEKKMLEMAFQCGVSVPKVVFFEKRNGYEFLATEYIPDELLNVLKECSIESHISMWNDLRENVHKLFVNNMVHTDIHEYNIRCKNEKIYLIDFEDSRILKQSITFEKSLDYVGYNGISTVGRFPYYLEEDYTVPYNCLARVKEVFNLFLASKVYDYTKCCNYDSENGICTTLNHGKSNMIYQGVKNQYFVVGGQRNENSRMSIIKAVLTEVFGDSDFTFIDVGSNNGLFCREVASFTNNRIRCIGLEGFAKFNILARGLAFLDNCENVEYIDFVCGQDSLLDLNIEGRCAFTICSVWHHIQNKTKFLEELKNLDIGIIILEMAEQDEVYMSGSWRNELDYIKKELGFEGEFIITHTSDYNRPFIVISKEEIQNEIKCNIKERAHIYQKMKQYNVSKNELMENYLKGDKKQYIVCFGAGTIGKRTIDFLGTERISFFIDNNSEKKIFEDHIVISPEKAIDILNNNTLIIITTASKYTDEIASQLDKLGITNYISFEELLQKGLLL